MIKHAVGRSATESATHPPKEVAIVSNYFFDTGGQKGNLDGRIELCSLEKSRVCSVSYRGFVVVKDSLEEGVVVLFVWLTCDGVQNCNFCFVLFDVHRWMFC